MGYKILHRQWNSRRALWVVMVAELLGVIAMLVLFGIAQPDLYRTQLWRAGNELGFNSSPNIILYAYANFAPLPDIPFVWSQTLTNFNVAISVVGLFILLVRMIGIIMHWFFPVVALFFNIGLVALYATSVYGQAGPDYASPLHPSPVAWYIAKPCSVANNVSVQKSCATAKGTFAATVILLAIYVAHLGLSIWAMLPNPANDVDPDSDDDESSIGKNGGRTWEMQGIPPTPRTATLPYTPRTMAFNTLDRKLPLRRE